MADASSWVIETSDADFERDVIERSRKQPVVVDFWAEWCGPCRMLGPVLEKLAEEAQGQFLLAKAEVERTQQVAAAWGVSSIPAVFGVRGGQVIDQFIGVLPEPQLREWLERLQPSPAERLVAEATELAQPDPAAAEAKLREALTLTPKQDAIKLALVRVLLAQDRAVDAEELLQELADRGFLEPEAEELQAELALRRMARETGGVEQARAAAAAAPDDRQAQWKLAQALAGQRQYEEALEQALRLVQLDRHGLGESARELMVELFRVLGPDHELTTTYRRKLSSALY
ncbi:MAG TPA: tetratricopeptide repeat protein [Pirellulales bacterium]|nr:tetratricopeptide repeat protein [Pirellulales bacterium]